LLRKLSYSTLGISLAALLMLYNNLSINNCWLSVTNLCTMLQN
jgi:hypothetical protein